MNGSLQVLRLEIANDRDASRLAALRDRAARVRPLVVASLARLDEWLKRLAEKS